MVKQQSPSRPYLLRPFFPIAPSPPDPVDTYLFIVLFTPVLKAGRLFPVVPSEPRTVPGSKQNLHAFVKVKSLQGGQHFRRSNFRMVSDTGKTAKL